MNNIQKLLPFLAVVYLAVFGLSSAYAQDGGSGFQIEEIVVTAERREETINDVPLSLTAFNTEALDQLGIYDDQDLEALTPGLQFGQEEEGDGQGTTMRGIGTYTGGASHADTAVAVYVNGAYSRSQMGIAGNMFDINRIEVARGPQGTLHGKNSIGGSISYFMNKPTDEWDVKAMAELTDQTTQRVSVAFGGPLIGPLSFRITAGSFTGDGAQENIGLGGDYDAPDLITYAPQLRLQSGGLDVNVRYSYSHDTGIPRSPLMLYNPERDIPYICDGPFAHNTMYDQLTDDNLTGTIGGVPYSCNGSYASPENPWYGYFEDSPAVADCGRAIANNCDELKNILNVNRPGTSDILREGWEVNASLEITDGLVLEYVYGENQLDQNTSRDLDLTNQIAPPTPNGTWYDRRNRSPFKMEDASHELQLVSNFDGPLNFIVGVYQHEGFNLWAVSRDNFAWDPVNYGDTLAACTAAGFEGSSSDWGGDNTYCTGDPLGDALGIDPVDNITQNYFGTDSVLEAEAFYAHVTYDMNEQWSFAAGARSTEDTKYRNVQFIYWDKRDINYMGDTPFTFIYQAVEKPTSANDLDAVPVVSWDAVIWSVDAEYRPTEDYMIYGRISTGYRAGGFNDSSAYNPPIKEEHLINYEGGVKGLFMDQRLNMQFSAFFQDFQDRQQVAEMDANLPLCSATQNTDCLQPTASSPLQEYTTNIPDSEIYGFELQGDYYVTPQIKVGGYYTFLESSLGTFTATTLGDPNPLVGTHTYLDTESGEMRTTAYNLPKDWTGSRLPQQPKHKWAITASYETTFDSIPGSFNFSGWLNYTGERYPMVRNIESQIMAAYNRVDVRATWTSPDENLTISGFVQNLMDETGLVAYLPFGGGTNPLYVPKGTLTDSRRMGVIVNWSM